MKEVNNLKDEVSKAQLSSLKAAAKGMLSDVPGTGVLIEAMNEAASRKVQRQLGFLESAYLAVNKSLVDLGEK